MKKILLLGTLIVLGIVLISGCEQENTCTPFPPKEYYCDYCYTTEPCERFCNNKCSSLGFDYIGSTGRGTLTASDLLDPQYEGVYCECACQKCN